MQRVLTMLISFNAPPLHLQVPRVARDMPSFADAYRGVVAAEKKPGVEAVVGTMHKVIAGPAIQARDKGIQLPTHQLPVYPVSVFGAVAVIRGKSIDTAALDARPSVVWEILSHEQSRNGKSADINAFRQSQKIAGENDHQCGSRSLAR
jgi:hypothetical protein